MALFALSARHIEDGALFKPVISNGRSLLPSARYLSEAIRSVPADFANCKKLEYAKAYGLISLCAIQMGHPSLLHQYLGLYHAYVAQNGMHDETRWPASLEVAERQICRCLLWSMYRLEVHSACVMGHMIRSQSSQLMVAYPTREDIEGEADIATTSAEHWITGWNFITDLYQVLEHTLLQYRFKRSTSQASRVFPILGTSLVADVLAEVSDMQERLPAQFQKTIDRPKDANQIRCNFQVANRVCTAQV